MEKSGAHEWVIEFAQEPNDLEAFAVLLDQELRRLNSDYDAKRQKDIALGRLIIHKAPKGTFYNWMRSRGKLGGQNKVPRLSNSREYVEDLLKHIALDFFQLKLIELFFYIPPEQPGINIFPFCELVALWHSQFH